LALASAEPAAPKASDAPRPIAAGGLPFRFFGDYELMEEIARGGMGVVYRARQLSLNRLVALKMILDGPLASRGFVERFEFEAEAAAKLSHPNIVPIYEIGERAGRHFFSMELLEGGNLGERMADFALPNRAPGERRAEVRERHAEIVRVMVAVARAVQHAHERGILHRDLKPANILLDAERQPHLTDFGLAKLVEEDSLLTQSGSLLGTPAYMAPEQAAGKTAQITTLADIYSLGAVLYHLLTGRAPFQASTVVETMRRVVEEEPVAPDAANPAADRDLSIICLKCLSKTPSRRYTSARSFAEDLERWNNGETILARPATGAERLSRWCFRKPAQAALAGTVLILLVAVALVATVAAIRINDARRVEKSAKIAATEKLWDSYLAQARSQRYSGRPGRRFDSLRAIASAAAIRPSLELRNEAIACLAVTDIRQIPGPPPGATEKDTMSLDWANERYARAMPDGSIVLRRLDTDAALFALPAQTNRPVESLRISPDGRWLASGYISRGRILWDLRDRARALVITNSVLSEEFRPDSRQYCFVDPDGLIVFVDLPDCRASPPVETPLVYATTRWSPDGNTIATTGTNEVFLITVPGMKATRHFPLPDNAGSMAWSPDGIRLAVGGTKGDIYIVDTRGDGPPKVLRGHQGSVTAVAFGPDGSLLASGSWDGKERIWDVEAGAEVISFPAAPETVTFSPDGRRLAIYDYSNSRAAMYELAGDDGTLSLRSAGTPLLTGRGLGDALLFGEKGDWLATSMDSALSISDARTGKLAARFEGYSVAGLARLPGEAGIFGWFSDTNLFRLSLERKEGALGGKFERFSPAIPAALAGRLPRGMFDGSPSQARVERSSGTPDGRWVALSYGYHAYVFDLASNTLRSVTGRQELMKFIALSPDGAWVATGGWNARGVKVWDAATGELVREIPSAHSPNVAFSPDGRWLAVEDRLSHRLFAAGSWREVHRIGREAHDDFPGPIAFSSDSKTLAACYQRTGVRLHSVATGDVLAQIEPMPEREVINVAFSPDDSQLALTRTESWPQIWKLKEIRRRLAALKLDW
jgi:WD40 repeat protein